MWKGYESALKYESEKFQNLHIYNRENLWFENKIQIS